MTPRGLRLRLARALAHGAGEPGSGTPSGPLGPRPPAPAGACVVCHAADVWHGEVRFAGDETLCKTVHHCRDCGYVGIDELPVDRYRGKTSVEELPAPTARVGTAERPGREFQMARLAVAILGRRRPQDVLVYGAGASLDNQHIARLPGVGKVSIADIMRVRDDAAFVDANDPGEDRFPIVVASEVVEHFRDPWADWSRLVGLVGPQGLLVAGTNIHDGRPKLARHRYLFHPDHTSYYSARSVRHLADRLGMHLDFRPVEGLGGRKRYLLLSRSPAVMARAADHFGTVELAPTEVTLRREQELARTRAARPSR